MTEKTKFIKGTFILVIANTIAKILGAIFKIPLSYILKEEGMAIYQTTFSVYSMFLTFVISGFPFASTKILAGYYAKNEKEKIKPLVYSVIKFMFIIGLTASIFMYAFAPYISVAMREPVATASIRLISPAILFVALGSVIKSSNEATSTLMPTAVSQVTEAIFKLFLGLYLATKLTKISIIRATEGAIFSVTVGEMFATLLLLVSWLIMNRRAKRGKADKRDIKEFFSLAIPLMFTVLASSMMSIANITAIRHALTDLEFSQKSAKSFLMLYAPYTDAFDGLLYSMRLTNEGARRLFGAYSGYAETIFNLPLGIISTVTAAGTPLFAKAITKSNKDLCNTSKKILSVILYLSVPSAFILFFYSKEILSLVFSNTFSYLILSSLAPSLIFLVVNSMMVAVLHLSGKIFEPFIALISGQVLKTLLSYALITIPEINILGAPLATLISSVITFVLLYITYRKNFCYGIGFMQSIITPLSSSLIMTGTGIPLLKYMTKHFCGKFSFVAVIIISAIIYLSMTIILNKKKGVIV